jgi:glyoxylase-like metal-dependent hydrolase (beta-lactamase superfamily II)
LTLFIPAVDRDKVSETVNATDQQAAKTPLQAPEVRQTESNKQLCQPNSGKEELTMAPGMFLETIRSPGLSHLSYLIGHQGHAAVIDTGFGEDAVAVFTGDALFVGDVGRTDFFPDRAEEVAGLLYDSIFNTILPLGDQVILYPAHGAGSVCGEGMVEREFSTLGTESRYNPALQNELPRGLPRGSSF